jgi:hypothetical protein
MNDTYLSVIQSLEHAACAVGRKLKATFVSSDDLDENDTSERALAALAVLERCVRVNEWLWLVLVAAVVVWWWRWW